MMKPTPSPPAVRKFLHAKVLPLAAETEMVVWVRNTLQSPGARHTHRLAAFAAECATSFTGGFSSEFFGCNSPRRCSMNSSSQNNGDQIMHANRPAKKWKAGVLGATGVVGQRLVQMPRRSSLV